MHQSRDPSWENIQVHESSYSTLIAQMIVRCVINTTYWFNWYLRDSQVHYSSTCTIPNFRLCNARWLHSHCWSETQCSDWQLISSSASVNDTLWNILDNNKIAVIVKIIELGQKVIRFSTSCLFQLTSVLNDHEWPLHLTMMDMVSAKFNKMRLDWWTLRELTTVNKWMLMKMHGALKP